MGTGAGKSQWWAKSNGEGGIRQPDLQGEGVGGEVGGNFEWGPETEPSFDPRTCC